MPHFVIEYSRPLETALHLEEVMDVVFAIGAASGIMNATDIKVRAIPYDHMRSGAGFDSFLHVTVTLLAGRTDEQKAQLSILLREALVGRFAEVGSISIDVRDMNVIAYKKRVLPPS
ncbi:MAG TPA: 5-carboxymethyl-2-hydroxymuconate Delta-isomerase [Ensifer sp.]|nr:5-carboxymethyl-2-hydroxymuconate Delta-isomerase [Ensifer sp.]